MALCSQAFSPASKRSCDFARVSQSDMPSGKRACLSKIDVNANRRAQPCMSKYATNVCYSSSSDSLSENEDSQSCYIADQIRAKRRASSRVSFSLDGELSKAVSQYSDDDGYGDANRVSESGQHSCKNDDNLDCKLSSSPSHSTLFVNNHNGNIHMSQRSSVSGSFFQISDSCSSVSSSKKSMPASDKHSRVRCFDYLVGAIDEAWARYCDEASQVESKAYGYNTPGSLATDDEDDCGNSTDLTDYESESEHSSLFQPKSNRKPSIIGPKMQPVCNADSTSTGKDPSSCQLQALKDRLTKAKYFLQDLVDSEDFNDAYAFWKRWDMIKYATIELVEDDDDDEVVESTIDELEDGRIFTN